MRTIHDLQKFAANNSLEAAAKRSLHAIWEQIRQLPPMAIPVLPQGLVADGRNGTGYFDSLPGLCLDLPFGVIHRGTDAAGRMVLAYRPAHTGQAQVEVYFERYTPAPQHQLVIIQQDPAGGGWVDCQGFACEILGRITRALDSGADYTANELIKTPVSRVACNTYYMSAVGKAQSWADLDEIKDDIRANCDRVISDALNARKQALFNLGLAGPRLESAGTFDFERLAAAMSVAMNAAVYAGQLGMDDITPQLMIRLAKGLDIGALTGTMADFSTKRPTRAVCEAAVRARIVKDRESGEMAKDLAVEDRSALDNAPAFVKQYMDTLRGFCMDYVGDAGVLPQLMEHVMLALEHLCDD